MIQFFSSLSSGAEPDTLRIIDVSQLSEGKIPAKWKHILPHKQLIYTNYSLEWDRGGPYLRALSGGTGSWLELELEDIDVSKYPVMEWMWKVNQFPETDWEKDTSQDDFPIRIELVYDYKGGKTFLNMVRKGIITSIFKGYPPELIVSYVWSLNVPFEESYQSPNSKRTMILPIESDIALKERWIHERRIIKDDLEIFNVEKTPLVLNKIRIRADTDDSSTLSESAVKYIYLIGGEDETVDY
ncbi:MAG: DUF3047 domain-containing protein [Candidatus Latescibacteria bacterium]|jgi:hypothetical protein|nr:DUF3047 domain-containing protein [Candidatus Latescibacterota bacterium]